MTFTPPSWSLQEIITETRLISGRVDAGMMSDAQVVNFINYYYQYVLPKELKIFWGYTYYEFYSRPNVDQYIGPADFWTINPQVWADGFPIEWYISPDLFYQDWPRQDNKQVVATGDGSTNSFSFNISAYPVLARSVYVTDGVTVSQDVPTSNSTGTFVSASTGLPVAGSIDYLTGTVSGVALPVVPASNANIQVSSQTYTPNRPQAILYFKSKPLLDSTVATRDLVPMFVIRPVPDQTYLIKMQGIQIPAPFTELSDVPFRGDLGPLIALGAALHIFRRFNQMDQYDQYQVEYNRFKDICMQDTYETYLYQRSVPKF